MKQWFSMNWLKLLAIAALLGTFGTFPYAYYQLMNWVVVGAALVTAMHAHAKNKAFLMWLFIFVAVVFNPIAPIYLSTQVWQWSDLVVIALFLFSFFRIESGEDVVMKQV